MNVKLIQKKKELNFKNEKQLTQYQLSQLCTKITKNKGKELYYYKFAKIVFD